MVLLLGPNPPPDEYIEEYLTIEEFLIAISCGIGGFIGGWIGAAYLSTNIPIFFGGNPLIGGIIGGVIGAIIVPPLLDIIYNLIFE